MEVDHGRRRLLARAALLAGGALSFGCTRALSLLPDDGPRRPSAPILDPARRARLECAIDLIIPETDTPGAVAAGVPDFVEMMLADYYYEDERDRVVAGLDELEARARRDHRVSFVDAEPASQTEILRQMEREGLEALSGAGSNPLASFTGGPPAPPPAFFQSLRELVAVGYTTSEVAARTVFAFMPFHHGYDGSVRITETTKPTIGGS